MLKNAVFIKKNLESLARQLYLSALFEHLEKGFMRCYNRNVGNFITYYISLFSAGITCLHLPNLTLLNIDETYIRPETIESLRTNCPSLEKFTYRTLNTPPRDESDFD